MITIDEDAIINIISSSDGWVTIRDVMKGLGMAVTSTNKKYVGQVMNSICNKTDIVWSPKGYRLNKNVSVDSLVDSVYEYCKDHAGTIFTSNDLSDEFECSANTIRMVTQAIKMLYPDFQSRKGCNGGYFVERHD